jgi:hypothetical protein
MEGTSILLGFTLKHKGSASPFTFPLVELVETSRWRVTGTGVLEVENTRFSFLENRYAYIMTMMIGMATGQRTCSNDSRLVTTRDTSKGPNR